MSYTKVLFIKLTSLGDLFHAFPALTDAKRACPNLQIDWLIDEHFAALAKWHPVVDRVFTTNHRRWREKPIASIHPIFKLIKTLRQTQYDLIIDGQGNFKTALLTLATRGPNVGYDRHSIREPIASFAYNRKCAISLEAHAIDRLRQLFAAALDYPLPSTNPEYLIDVNCFSKPPIPLPERYIVFVHNASWKTKIWPEEHGIELIKLLTKQGISVLLPWGNEEEKKRAYRLAINEKAIVLPKLSLSEMGFVLSKAFRCIGMDTGLSHLAAALNIPSMTLYGATDAGLNGANGQNQLHLRSTLPCSPCKKKYCRFPCKGMNPPCLAEITPERVFKQLFTNN